MEYILINFTEKKAEKEKDADDDDVEIVTDAR